MRRLTRLVLDRPRGTLAAWGLAMVVLTVIGLGVERRLAEGTFLLPGTQSARAQQLDHGGFGVTELTAVLVTGPAGRLGRDGRRLVADLRRRWTVLSPWDSGAASSALRPSRRAALLLVDLRFRANQRSHARLLPLERVLAADVHPPLAADITSNSVGTEATNGAAIDAAKQSQKIAVPVLLVVLLLVFRSPLAAAIPAVVGLATVEAAPGVMALVARVYDINGVSLSVAAMMGLALGVDYSLLIVSRFREQLASDAAATPSDAAAVAAATAGRTVTFAGAVLLVTMALALALSPGAVLLSIAAGVVVAVVLSLGSAAIVVPPALALVGRRIDRWRIGAARVHSPLLTNVARAAMGRPLLVSVAALLVLLALATPALALHTSPPVFSQLPPDHPARRAYEAIRHTVSPGFVSPFELVIHSERGPITEPRRLTQIASLQDVLARDQAVSQVVGPGPITRRTSGLDQLQDLPQRLTALRGDARRAQAGVGQLRSGLAQAATGAAALESGALAATVGAEQLKAGGGAAAAGGRALTVGASQAARGAHQLAGGLGAAAGGARRLEAGAHELENGAGQLTAGIGAAGDATTSRLAPDARSLAAGLAAGVSRLQQLREPAAVATDQVQAAYRALSEMTLGRADPRYGDAIRAAATADGALTGQDPTTGARLRADYPGLVAALDEADAALRSAAAGAGQLAQGATRLGDGLARLERGSTALARGAARLDSGNAVLAAGLALLAQRTTASIGGLDALASGMRTLAGGVDRLSAGAGQLTEVSALAGGARDLGRGLAGGYRRSAALRTGIARASDVAVRFSTVVAELAGASGTTPASSGHLVLAALGNSPMAEREQAAMVVNAQGAGDTARVYVVPRYFAVAPGNVRLHDRLVRLLAAFGLRSHLDAAVGGLAGQYVDFERDASAYIPTLVICLSLATFALLVVILRALVLPAVAILLNLTIVAAALGVLELLFQGRTPLLGGPGFVDVITLAAILTVLFALSVDYEVFLLTRMHEAYATGRDATGAVIHGISRTASVVTGAALIMTAVFLSFATSAFIVPRQFGVGLAIAVLLDALLLRLFLLPAAMRLLGRRSWWLPAWLDRLMPRLDVEGSAARH